MNFKKTIAKSLVVAMALGMVPMANLESARADISQEKIDGKTGLLTATGAKYWGVAKESKEGKGTIKIGDKHYKISNIEEFYDEVDAYSLLKGKAGNIAIGEKSVPDDKWKVVTIPAADSTFKVQFVASKGAVKGLSGGAKHALGGDFGYLLATTGKKELTEIDLKTDHAKYEGKLNDGDWQTLEKLFGAAPVDDKVTAKLKVWSQSGSTLTFRAVGANNKWPSKESKVKITAQAKAPNVKVDITKETVSIKKGMQWQVQEIADNGAANGIKPADWKNFDGKVLTFAELKLPADKNAIIYVRTGASAKKTASKVASVILNKPAAKLQMPDSNEIKATGSAIGNIAVVETTLAYDLKKGATLTNKTNEPLEWALVGKEDKTVKWNTLKGTAAKAKKLSAAKLNYSATKKANTWGADGVKLFLRKSGVKQDKNGVATLSGVSAGAIIKMTPIEQKFSFFKDGNVATPSDKATITVSADGVTKAAITIATETAVKFTIKAKVTNPVKTGVAPKIKVDKDSSVKGVTVKADKIGADGKFDIHVDVSKTTFKTEPKGTLKADFTFEGIKSGFEITFAKK